uniref:Ankyrin repeat domain-containing protein 40 n=1 Tax=Cacopsylla melanoneura TaxID=428564 RepID=A0A8D8M4X5_9HEMI
MERMKYFEEQLRESACLGDIETVCELIAKGIDINAQHDMNGWTALHWAAKRGQKDIVSYLLKHGADKTLLTSKDETPLALATKPEVRILLGGEPGVTINTGSDLPIVPSYIKNPPLDTSDIYQATNRRTETSEQRPSSDLYQSRSTQNGGAVGDIYQRPSQSQNGPVNSSSSQTTIVTSSATSGHHGAPQQPEELVLKIRIAGDPQDDDFIEIELSAPAELTYYSLVNIGCKELAIDSPSSIFKVRKLPNTIVRKDKDVARLTQFQELEFVLNSMSSRESNPGLNGVGSLTSKGVNNYPSIHKFKNQTILY